MNVRIRLDHSIREFPLKTLFKLYTFNRPLSPEELQDYQYMTKASVLDA